MSYVAFMLGIVSSDAEIFMSSIKSKNIFCLSAAGNAFSQAALLHLQMQSKHDAATNFIDAGNAFKKADPQGLLFFYLLN